MEKILVSIDSQNVALGAIYRAIHLAIRIKAAVYILQVLNADEVSLGRESLKRLDDSAKDMLDSLIEMARSDGVTVNFYVTEGDFMDEVVRFVRQENISLLVLGVADKGLRGSQESSRIIMDGILKRVNCAVELVHQKAPLFMSNKQP